MLNCIFQVAAITRPLMSVSKMCDQDLSCLFTKKVAKVFDENQNVVCEFQREGGLYVATLKLKRPKPKSEQQPFTRPGR